MGSAAPAWSETTPVLNTVQETVAPQPAAAVAGKIKQNKRIDWVAMPIPISNPTLGSGLAAATTALYRLEGAAQPSQTALGVFKTDNGSKGAGLLQETYLGHSNWQVNGLALQADLNLDFYGIGADPARRKQALPFNQIIRGGALWVMDAVAPGWSIGPRYRWDTVQVSPIIEQSAIDELSWPSSLLQVDVTESTLELLVDYDTRDSRFGPSRGWFAEFSAAFTDEAIGSDLSYQRYTLAVNGYRRLRDRLVLGVRGSLCKTSDSAPFFALCQFGMLNDLRGYVVGRYRDQAMFATQAELRWSVWRRFGLVAFAGAGNIAERFSDLTFAEPLTSAGVGIRYLASQDNRVNVGIDAAHAQGEYSFYFRIGEAF